MGGISTYRPVVTSDSEAALAAVLSFPFSYVSTEGPRWRTPRQCDFVVSDEDSSHLLVSVSGDIVGAVSWSRGQTPGFFRLCLRSSSDESWTSELVEQSVTEAMTYLLRGFDVRRVELVIGSYNVVMLDYLTSCGRFVAEGILRDRFFLDGTYWPGIIARADVAAFRHTGGDGAADRSHLLSLVFKKTLDDLGAALAEAVETPGG